MTSFSPRSLRALVDVISGGRGTGEIRPIGIYRSGPEISRLLADCDLEFCVTSSRVPELSDFLRHVSRQPDGQGALLRVVERVADPADYRLEPDRCQRVIEHINEALADDGFEVRLVGSRAYVRPTGASNVAVSSVIARAQALDFDTVHREVDRALASAQDDPEDAVTAANALLEAVCRSILVELSIDLPARKDIDSLIRAVQEPLGLSPARTDLPAEIADDVRRILGGLTSTAKGIGALRTHGGDAHGRERGFVRIDRRIARLAIHAAASVAEFLIETWEQKHRRPLRVQASE